MRRIRLLTRLLRQREERVTHLVAHRLIDLSPMLGELTISSRNFH